MSKQRTRRRRTRCAVARAIAVGGAVATLVAILGTGPAAASTAPPDERILERQTRIDQQKAEQLSRQQATELPQRWTRPEPPMSTESRLGLDQLTPAPPPPAKERPGPGLAVPASLAALVLALAAITTWRIRRHPARPGPDPTT
jgi:hypothetical protein